MTFNRKNNEILSDNEEKNIDYYKNKVKTLKKNINNNKNVISKNIISNNKWTEENYQVINYWLDVLKFNHTINYFYFFKLKKIEGIWAWTLIVFSAISSSISLFQFNDKYYYLNLVSKIFLSLLTILTTLIAAWMKKQNYIERVAELDKYILKTKKIIGSLEADLELPLENRISFDEFIKLYKDKIIEFNSMTPLISPDDWKDTIYVLTKYYPEISSSLYPWNKYPEFALQIIDTYIYNKYNSCFKKIYNCFFCQSICCNSRYNTKNLEENIKKIYEKKDLLKPDAIKFGGITKTQNISDTINTKLKSLLNPKTKIPLTPSFKKKRATKIDNEYDTDTDIEFIYDRNNQLSLVNNNTNNNNNTSDNGNINQIEIIV